MKTDLVQTTELDPLLRIEQVLQIVPVCKATWYGWMRTGRAPAGKKLGTHLRVWPASEIDAFAKSLSN